MKIHHLRTTLLIFLSIPYLSNCSSSEDEFGNLPQDDIQLSQQNFSKTSTVDSWNTITNHANSAIKTIAHVTQHAARTTTIFTQGGIAAVRGIESLHLCPNCRAEEQERRSMHDALSSDSSSNSDSETEYRVVEHTNKKRIKFFASKEEFDENMHANPEKTIDIVNTTMRNYFKQNPESVTTQKHISHLAHLLQTSEKKVMLQSVIADKYNQQQLNILHELITYHATKIIPQADQKHTMQITRAQEEYNRRMTRAERKLKESQNAAQLELDQRVKKSLEKIKIYAQNTAYINSCATQLEADLTQPELHATVNTQDFNNTETFRALLARYRSEQTTTNSSNNLGASGNKKKKCSTK